MFLFRDVISLLRNAIYYRHFRPEFLQLYKTPLSSDALSQFGRRDVEQDKMAILTAYGALHHMILSFASRVDDLQVGGSSHCAMEGYYCQDMCCCR